ncbi:unnamed protein product [Phytophthora fragariaefolia]|uniref:Unnamed protein product n=1 Tax=Phytophthora fragariaefolia TaxID=1490495 RepID=A0A9W6YDK5_9STRA|nr:unnamed protein product [Phytophthora fragariaefolia]
MQPAHRCESIHDGQFIAVIPSNKLATRAGDSRATGEDACDLASFSAALAPPTTATRGIDFQAARRCDASPKPSVDVGAIKKTKSPPISSTRATRIKRYRKGRRKSSTVTSGSAFSDETEIAPQG